MRHPDVGPNLRAMSDLVRVERSDDAVALLTLDRPPVNALSGELLAALAEAATEVAADAAVRAVVVTGEGKSFAAGANIDEFVIGDPDANRALIATFRRALDALAAIPRPVIAAVNGFALGGGLEVALACDLRIAADNARLGVPEIQLGLIPGAGGTQRLARLLGPARAKELVWSGRPVAAEEALAIGLVDRTVEAASLRDAALEWAATFARGASLSIAAAKRAIDSGLDVSLAAGLDLETEEFIGLFSTEDHATGITSFREQGPGKATFSGRSERRWPTTMHVKNDKMPSTSAATAIPLLPGCGALGATHPGAGWP